MEDLARPRPRCGITCPSCRITYTSSSVLRRRKLADAELLFCPRCKVAIAAVRERIERQSA